MITLTLMPALGPVAERHLIRYISRHRSEVLQQLEEARADLAHFAASLQAKQHMVAKLEHDAASASG